VGPLTGITRQPHSLVFKVAAYPLQQYFTGLTRVPHLIVAINFCSSHGTFFILSSGECSAPMKGLLFTAHWFASNFQLVPFPHFISCVRCDPNHRLCCRVARLTWSNLKPLPTTSRRVGGMLSRCDAMPLELLTYLLCTLAIVRCILPI